MLSAPDVKFGPRPFSVSSLSAASATDGCVPLLRDAPNHPREIPSSYNRWYTNRRSIRPRIALFRMGFFSNMTDTTGDVDASISWRLARGAFAVASVG